MPPRSVTAVLKKPGSTMLTFTPKCRMSRLQATRVPVRGPGRVWGLGLWGDGVGDPPEAVGEGLDAVFGQAVAAAVGGEAAEDTGGVDHAAPRPFQQRQQRQRHLDGPECVDIQHPPVVLDPHPLRGADGVGHPRVVHQPKKPWGGVCGGDRGGCSRAPPALPHSSPAGPQLLDQLSCSPPPGASQPPPSFFRAPWGRAAGFCPAAPKCPMSEPPLQPCPAP